MIKIKLAYYPGCTLKTNSKNFEDSAIISAEVLGIELIEIKRWNCCGTVHALAKDSVMHHLAPIRNLLRVEEIKKANLVDKNQVVTLCAMCYNTLKRSNQVFNDDNEKKEKIHDIMSKEETQYNGKTEVVHYLEILKELGWDKIKENVKKPLKELKVAPYYGCLLLRPRGLGIDDTDNPTILEDLLRALGVNVIDFPYKQKCCGSYHAVHMKEVVADLSYKILENAKQAGAEIVVTACPLCDFNIGSRQTLIRNKFPQFNSMPILFFTQLITLAFGLGKTATVFEGNQPDPRPLLIEKGIITEE